MPAISLATRFEELGVCGRGREESQKKRKRRGKKEGEVRRKRKTGDKDKRTLVQSPTILI
jgi:hypothetical protein